ncbi:MAG: Hpt domain-containing protein, partial [Otoolea sp.]
MSLEECYQLLGGDYADVCRRLPSKKLVEKFIGKFLEDKSFEALCAMVQDGNRKEAFLAAHTLKGICANLGFQSLLYCSGQLTELLRPETDTIPEAAQPWMERVKKDY